MRYQVAAILVCGLLGSTLLAQSLGDVAQQEEARRKAVKAGKVYTNDTLKKEPAATPPAPGDAAAATAPKDKPADEAKKAPDPKKADAAKAEQAAAGEAFWKKRLQAERDAIARNQTFVEALQSRINALSTDFVNRDDPFQRNQIAGDKQKATAELDRVKKEIQDHTKTIADIQEEGRKAGVPAAWLR